MSLALSAVLRGETVVLGWLLLLGAAFLWFKAWLYAWSTELAVTSKRVIAKLGFIRCSTVELRHSKVESLHVDQSLLGRFSISAAWW